MQRHGYGLVVCASVLLIVPGSLLWSLTIIAVDVVALWGLCA